LGQRAGWRVVVFLKTCAELAGLVDNRLPQKYDGIEFRGNTPV
jgi:hypothetical protein